MAETIRIEIPIEIVDNTDPALSKVSKKFERMGKTADSAGRAAQKASGMVSQFDRHAEKTERSLARWAKEKYEILLEARDRVSPVLSDVGGYLKRFFGRTWSMTLRAADFVTAPVRGIIDLLKNPILQAGAVLGVGFSIKDSIETYKEFETAMSQVRAISGATASEMALLTNKAREMGAITKFSAYESAEAFNYMAMAGWKTDDMLDGIEGILSLAAASGEDLAQTSDIVTDALTAFNMKASEAGHFSDVLAAAASNANTTVAGMGETFKYAGSMAGSLGYSIEDVALMTGLMANSGIKGTMAGTALNAIFTRLSTNASGAADVIRGLGIEFFDANGQARDLSDVIDQLRQKTAGMTAEHKSSIANTIAGMEAQKGLLAILNASQEDYDKLSIAINNADGSAKTMADTMMDNLAGTLEILQGSVEEVKLNFGGRLTPYVKGLAEWITDQMPEIDAGIDQVMDWVDAKTSKIKRRFDELTETQEWQEASLFGKINISWNEFVAEPFEAWWNETGKTKIAEIAGEIGEGIGSGLQIGIMTMLGIDVSSAVDDGASIGASFAQGFLDGFDLGDVVGNLWGGIKNLFSNATDLIPGGKEASLSSLLSAMLLFRVASPLVDLGVGTAKAGRALFGAQEALGGASLISTLVGSTGNAMVGGTGILGSLANVGYAISGGSKAGLYFGGTAGAMSGGAAAIMGAGALAGGVIGGTSLISGMFDAYKSAKSEDQDESAAYGEAAGWKFGGVAAGAMAGAALGSVVPVLGTTAGALIGAGAGGIAGLVRGNKAKTEYAETVKEMERQTEIAQLCFDVTGKSIKEVRFENEILQKSLNDTQVSAAEFSGMLQESYENVKKNTFGEINLSLAETKQLAEDITFGSSVEKLSEFTNATSETEKSLKDLRSTVYHMKKENWKVSIGMELNELEKDNYRNSIEDFTETAQEFINNSRYEATVALKLLTGVDTDTAGLDRYYNGINEQMDSLGSQLTERMHIALQDSVITLDESAEIESLQEQIAEIANKLADAKAEAEIETLQIKYSGAELTADSFDALQEELKMHVESASEEYQSALTLTLTNLKLELAEGAITQQEYDEAVQAATEGYYAEINEINARVSSFNLGTIAEAWESSLDGLLPEIEGTTQIKLQEAMNRALSAHPDVSAWTQPDVAEWFGLSDLDLSGEEIANITYELIQSAYAVPEGAKESIIEDFKASVPSAEEIMEALDWDDMTFGDYNSISDMLFGDMDGPELTAGQLDDTKLADYYGEYFEKIKESYSTAFHNALANSGNQETLSDFINQYMEGQSAQIAEIDFLAPYSQAIYDQLEEMDLSEADWDSVKESLSSGMVTAIEGADMERVRAALAVVKGNVDESASTIFGAGYDVEMPINITFSYSIKNPEIPVPALPSAPLNVGITKHAAGGYVSGGPQLSWLAEEGYGEYIIPTNPSRRSRALELYEAAGKALGVSQTYKEKGYKEHTADKMKSEKSDAFYFESNYQDNPSYGDSIQNERHSSFANSLNKIFYASEIDGSARAFYHPEETSVYHGDHAVSMLHDLRGGSNGEYIIPTNPSRRSRALELYEAAGKAHKNRELINWTEKRTGDNLINGEFAGIINYWLYNRSNKNDYSRAAVHFSPTKSLTTSDENNLNVYDFMQEENAAQVYGGSSIDNSVETGFKLHAYASGGYASSPQLSLLAEAGYGEYVIPTDPSKRDRALSLLISAGEDLGINEKNMKGYGAGPASAGDLSASYAFTDAISQKHYAMQMEDTDFNQSEEVSTTFSSVSSSNNGNMSSVSTPIQVNIQLSPEFVINKGEERTDDDIVSIIRKHMKEMADELGGEIAGNLDEVFANMPLKGV